MAGLTKGDLGKSPIQSRVDAAFLGCDLLIRAWAGAPRLGAQTVVGNRDVGAGL